MRSSNLSLRWERMPLLVLNRSGLVRHTLLRRLQARKVLPGRHHLDGALHLDLARVLLDHVHWQRRLAIAWLIAVVPFFSVRQGMVLSFLLR